MSRAVTALRRLSDGANCRLCAASAVAATVALLAAAYGLSRGDVVTVLGTLPMLAAAGLLAAIGVRERARPETGSDSGGTAP